MELSRRRFIAASVASPVLAASGSQAAVSVRPRIGIAFGSGSQHGLAHIGAIKALAESGVRPDVVTGTSVGAIAGALWASGLDWERIRRAAGGMSWIKGRRLSLDLGLLRNDAVRRLIEEQVRGRPIEDWPIRFGAIATDFTTGARVLLSSGDAAAAVTASSSLPVLYTPVSIAGRALVDGALAEPVPIRAARELGADVVIAIDVAFRPSEEPARNLLDAPFQAMHILVNRLIDEQIGEADLAIRLDLHHLFSEPDTEQRLLEAGERAVLERRALIAAALERPPGPQRTRRCVV